MTTEDSDSTKLCPTCGTRLSDKASRCLVCGADLKKSTKSKGAELPVSGSRMPEITLSLPVALGFLALFLSIGAVLVFFAMRGVNTPNTPTDVPLTATQTATASLTPTAVEPTITHTPLPSPTPLTYFVKVNETCSEIAFAFKVSIQSIILLNNLSADCTLYEGQPLFIPHPTPTVTPLPTATLSGFEATKAACDLAYHTVEEDDTLSTIAANYQVPINAIKEWNGMSTDTVFTDTVLEIPLCERLNPGGPTTTPTSPPPYPAPNLLLPLDGEAFTLADDNVVLQWSSVGTLRENESYQVTILDVTEGLNRTLVVEVTDTKYIVPSTSRPNESTPHVFRWWVETVRQNGTDDEGKPIWISAGATSEIRTFTWSGAVQAPSPTP